MVHFLSVKLLFLKLFVTKSIKGNYKLWEPLQLLLWPGLILLLPMSMGSYFGVCLLYSPSAKRFRESCRLHTCRGALQFYCWTLPWLRTMIDYWRKEFLYFLPSSFTHIQSPLIFTQSCMPLSLVQPIITSSELGG
jgi:hypothetical protein